MINLLDLYRAEVAALPTGNRAEYVNQARAIRVARRHGQDAHAAYNILVESHLHLLQSMAVLQLKSLVESERLDAVQNLSLSLIMAVRGYHYRTENYAHFVGYLVHALCSDGEMGVAA